ncbi:MAG TPA: DUF6599 family protein [Minicystis sp.]|nr:DUF6599 family protein [Minicystis sp.]
MLTRSPRALSLSLLLVAAAAATSGCKSNAGEESRRAPPPPVASSKPGACAEGGGKVDDAEAAAALPKTSGGYCLDPNGGSKAYGDGAALAIEKICDVFDGECEIYRGYGIKKLVEARYVDGAGSPATIDVHLSKFASTDGAYGMFTKRVVGDGDPADAATPRPIPGGGRAALGLGNAYLWRGPYLVELTYNDETAGEAALKAASDKLLPPLVAAIGAKLQGDTTPPGVALLPAQDRIPLGERYVTKDVLGIGGVGPGAIGYYKAGEKRFRMAALPRGDADQAKDVIATMLKLPGAAREKHLLGGGVRLMHKDGDGPAVEWVFARKGKDVVGIGDEPRALKPGATPDEHAKVSLTADEKMQRLKALE